VRLIAVALMAVCWPVMPAAAQSVAERLPACLSCHGENGQSQNTGVPSLGAQQSYYVTIQLLMFRDRLRIADPMNDMAKGLSDDELTKFADIISKLPAPQPVAGLADDARMARGRALVEENRCNFCHTATLVAGGPTKRAAYCRPARGISRQSVARL
jgi:cytochrome c553